MTYKYFLAFPETGSFNNMPASKGM